MCSTEYHLSDMYARLRACGRAPASRRTASAAAAAASSPCAAPRASAAPAAGDHYKIVEFSLISNGDPNVFNRCL